MFETVPFRSKPGDISATLEALKFERAAEGRWLRKGIRIDERNAPNYSFNNIPCPYLLTVSIDSELPKEEAMDIFDELAKKYPNLIIQKE